MSDDNGDAANEPAPPAGPRAGDTSIDGHLESIHRSLATLGSRIDALVTSTTTYRSALTDRLTEYANLVSKLNRAQAADLEEYRQANERTVAELRRSLAGSDDVMERIGERIESLLTDQESADDGSRAVLGEVRSILDSQENLSRSLHDSLDRFGERLVERLLVPQTALLDEMREALLDVASGEVVGALWDEFRAARESLDTLVARSDEDQAESRTGDSDADEALRAEVSGLTTTIRDLLAQAEVVDESAAADEATAVLDTVAADIAALRSELSEGLVVEPSEALAGTVDQLRAELAGLDDRMRAVTESILDRREEAPRPDESLAAVGTDLTALRAELVSRFEALSQQLADSEGLLVEPSEAVAATVEQLRADLAGLDERMRAVTESILEQREEAPRPDGTLAAVGADLSALRADLVGRFEALSRQLADVATPEVSDADVEGELRILRTGVEGIDGELRGLRTGVEDIIGRLDEGIGLAEELAPPASPAASPELVDQFATIRDQVTTEFDALRQLLDGVVRSDEAATPSSSDEPIDLAPITELLEHLRDDLAELPDRVAGRVPAAAPETGAVPEYVPLDPDTLDLLREEIRTAGGVSDEVLSALRNDLIALRRRIKLRAEGELFTAEQLDRIAEEVARRIAT